MIPSYIYTGCLFEYSSKKLYVTSYFQFIFYFPGNKISLKKQAHKKYEKSITSRLEE